MLWVAVQLAALCVAASGVELSAHFVRPASRLAIVEMIVVQFALSGMLFPFLLRSARACAAMMIVAAPFLALAGALSKSPVGVVAGAWTCLSIWLVTWTIVSRTTPTRHRATAVAVANAVGLGGMMLWYLSSEFGGETGARCFPMVSVVRFVLGWEALIVALITNAAMLMLAILLRAFRPREH